MIPLDGVGLMDRHECLTFENMMYITTISYVIVNLKGPAKEQGASLLGSWKVEMFTKSEIGFDMDGDTLRNEKDARESLER